MNDRNIPTGWISVKDMMPPNGVTVLVYSHKAYGHMHPKVSEIPEMRMGTAMAYEGKLDSYPGEVTHWRLLPPPPEVLE